MTVQAMPRQTATAKSGTVLCLGLEPALQRTMLLDRFRPGEVNRASEIVLSTGGKAVNTARALSVLRRASVVCGFNGGDTGRFIAAQLTAHGVTCAFTRTPWTTRTCTTILDSACGQATELVEEASRPTPQLLQRFENRGLVLLGRARACVICGTLPAGAPVNFWARFTAAARRLRVPLVIDSHAIPLLRALRGEPLLAKMNVCELEKTLGVRCRTEAQLVSAARRLTTGGAAWALITRGPQPALLVSRVGTVWRITPPEVAATVSPVGSGDCVTAGVVHALLHGDAMPEAVRFGLGCGSANALTCSPSDFRPAIARKFASSVRCDVVASHRR